MFTAPRDYRFKAFISSLISKSKLKPKYRDALLSEDSLKRYGCAFTAPSISSNNYEVFEQLGDVTVNKFVVWYMHRRFPPLNSAENVKVVARLRIIYGSKESLYKIADSLGFWEYISSNIDDRQRKRKSLLEDVFEAFVGVTEYILDGMFFPGVGYSIVYDILKSIFDEIPISLKYNDLFDAKTRLKELFDFSPDLRDLKYTSKRIESGETSQGIPLKLFYTTLTATINGERVQVITARGPAPLKADSERIVAEEALKRLQFLGYTKPIPKAYEELEKL